MRRFPGLPACPITQGKQGPEQFTRGASPNGAVALVGSNANQSASLERPDFGTRQPPIVTLLFTALASCLKCSPKGSVATSQAILSSPFSSVVWYLVISETFTSNFGLANLGPFDAHACNGPKNGIVSVQDSRCGLPGIYSNNALRR